MEDSQRCQITMVEIQILMGHEPEMNMSSGTLIWLRIRLCKVSSFVTFVGYEVKAIKI